MKILFVIACLFVTCISFSQNNYIVKTDDGRRVLLKADFTWEYIDADSANTKANKKAMPLPEANTASNCGIDAGFEEPALNQKIQNQLKKGRATIEDVKYKVSKDYNCDVSDVVLLSFKEQKAKATYNFCVKGTKVTYKRTGFSIIKSWNMK